MASLLPQEMANWYHLACIFNAQKRARAWKIDSVDMLTGLGTLSAEDQARVKAAVAAAAADTSVTAKPKPKAKQTTLRVVAADGSAPAVDWSTFAAFAALAARISAEPSSLAKTAIISQAFQACKTSVAVATLLITLLLPGMF